MELVAFLGEDTQSWGQVKGLINNEVWEKIVLVNSTEEKFPLSKNEEVIKVNSKIPLVDLKNELSNKLKKSFSGLDVCVSIASGNGKEHMALISALLSIPVGIRLVVFTKKGVEIIN